MAGAELAAACADGDAERAKELIEVGAYGAGTLGAALRSAAEAGQAACVQPLVDAGVGVDFKAHDGRSALHIACFLGHAACAEALIAAGAGVDVVTPGGYTALQLACQTGHVACVQLLIAEGADVDAATQLGITALHLACFRGHAACVQLMIEAGARLEAVLHDGCTALHAACLLGQAVCAQLLIAAGADVGASTPLRPLRRKVSPLQAAVQSDDYTDEEEKLAVVQLLCVRGASIGLPPRHPTSRWSLAAQLREERGANAVSDWLARAALWTTRLHHVELLSEAEAVEELRAGADLYAGVPTPLSLASDALLHDPWHGAASAVVAASRPWSPQTHRLFSHLARARAVELLMLGYELSDEGVFVGEEAALQDVWVGHVLPNAVER